MAELQHRLSVALAEHYTVEREVGRGGMARVFLAEQRHPRRRVAIKVLDPEISLHLGPDRFLREVDLAWLTHPHILPIFAAGEADGLLYYVMPYVEGESLRERLQRDSRLPLKDVFRITGEVVDALTYAHSHGIIHRDIKPGNILLEAGHAVVADFGIARALTAAGDISLTGTGFPIGTPAYMSPEQAAGEEVDARSDLYSLGCVVHEMLSGEPPYSGLTAQAVFFRHAQESTPSLRSSRPRIPRRVARAVQRALAKRPEDRFASAADFLAALQGEQPAWPLTLGTMWRRHPGRIMAAAIGISLVGFLAWNQFRVPARFHERDWILVADFEGGGSDADLSEAVRELTTVELNQSRFLSTLSRQQLNATMRLAGLPETTHVGPDLARELAVRSAVRAVLVGSIKPLGDSTYSIVLHVVDAETGENIVSAAEAASDTGLVNHVQKAARAIRRGLGERRQAIEATLPLYQVATPSFPAYRRYLEGVRLQSRGDGQSSNRLLREAIALDTGFASAWHSMGWNYINERVLDSAQWAFGEALKRRERLTESQRYRLEADVAYTLHYDVPAAIRAYDMSLVHWPRSWAVHNNRGLYLLALGRYEDALESFTRAVEVHPFGPRQAQIQVMNQAATLIALGRVSEGEQVARELTGPFAQYTRLMSDVATGRWREADSLGTLAATAPSSPTWLRVQATAVAAGSRAVRGAVQSADRSLADAGQEASPEAARWFQRARLLLALAADRPMPSLPDRLRADTTAPGSVTTGLWAALVGDTMLAHRALRRLRQPSSPELARLGSGPLLIEAWLAARDSRWREAANLLGPAAFAGEHDTSVLDRVGSLSLRWLAAEAYARNGQADSATALLELAITPRRMPGNEFAQRGLVLAFAHRRLARWYAEAGRGADALAHWRAFLETVTEPDAELAPLLAEARNEVQRLSRS